MAIKNVITEVNVDVDFDACDFDTDELVEEIESRGLFVLDQDDSCAVSEAARDQIYSLYREYINGSNFERKLKDFFEDQLGILIN